MKDLIRFGDKEILVPKGTRLRHVVNLVTDFGKSSIKIHNIRKIPIKKGQRVLWEIKFSE